MARIPETLFSFLQGGLHDDEEEEVAKPEIKKLISSSANRNVDTFRSYSLPPSSLLLSRQAVTTSNPLKNLKDFHSSPRNTTDQLAVESGRPVAVRVPPAPQPPPNLSPPSSSVPPPSSTPPTHPTTSSSTSLSSFSPTSSLPPRTSLSVPPVQQQATPLPASTSTRLKGNPQVAGGHQVKPHLTSSLATGDEEETLTSGREESGAEEELHHSSSSRSKEWQQGGGGQVAAAIQEQPTDSRSPLLGLTAPGENLHMEPEGREEVDESEYDMQGMSPKEVQDLVKSKGRFRVDQVGAEENNWQKSDVETLEAKSEDEKVEKEKVVKKKMEEENVEEEEEDVKLNEEQENVEEKEVSRERYDEVESEKTLAASASAAEENGKRGEDVEPGEVVSPAKSEQVDLQTQVGPDDQPPLQLDPDVPLLYRGLAEQEDFEEEGQREETVEVKVVEEQILKFESKTEKTVEEKNFERKPEKTVEERRNQPREHDPDHLSDSVDLAREENKEEISFTPELDPAGEASLSLKPGEKNDSLIGGSESRSRGNYAENVVEESEAGHTYPFNLYGEPVHQGGLDGDDVGGSEEDGEDPFEEENIPEEIFGASTTYEGGSRLTKGNVPVDPVDENAGGRGVTEWEWGGDARELDAPLVDQNNPLVDQNKKKLATEQEERSDAKEHGKNRSNVKEGQEGPLVSLKEDKEVKEGPLVTLMEVEEHSMQLLLTPKSWQPQDSVRR